MRLKPTLLSKTALAGLCLPLLVACRVQQDSPVLRMERPGARAVTEQNGEFEFARDLSAESLRAMAASTETPSGILDWLASDPDFFVRRKVAANRNTAPEALAVLVLDRTAVVRHAAVLNAQTPAAAVEGATGDWNSSVAWAVRRRTEHRRRLEIQPRGRSCDPAESTAELELQAADADYRVRLCAARRLDLPKTTLRLLGEDAEPTVRAAVAAHPRTPPKVLHQLVRDRALVVRLGVAANQETPPSALEGLADDSSTLVRARVASHPALPAALLAKLSDDEEPSIRLAAGLNPAAPDAFVIRLTRDSDPWVQRALAESGATSPAALSRLAAEGVVSPRSLVRHPSTPDGTKQILLANLLASDDPEMWDVVARRAGGRSDLRIQALWKLFEADPGHRRLPQHPLAPVELLVRLAAEAPPQAREALARRRPLPEEVQRVLARDSEARVRRRLAFNAGAVGDVLAFLAVDGDERVRTSAAANSNTPPPSLDRLAKDAGERVRAAVAGNEALGSEAAERILTELAGSDSTNIRKLVAQNGRTPVPVLERLAGDAEAEVRLAVVWNRSTPETTMVRLSRDSEPRVRRALDRRRQP